MASEILTSQIGYEWTRAGFERAAVKAGRASKKLTTVESMIAGALAGSATVLITNPIWVVNTRMTARQSNSSDDVLPGNEGKPRKKRSTIGTLMSLIRDEGPAALFAGVFPALILVINPILQYTVFEQLKNMLEKRRRVMPKDAFILGAIGKLMATSITYPYITIKSRMHVASQDGPQDNMFESLRRIIREEGWGGLYKGAFEDRSCWVWFADIQSRYWTEGYTECHYSCVLVCVQGCALRNECYGATKDTCEASSKVRDEASSRRQICEVRRAVATVEGLYKLMSHVHVYDSTFMAGVRVQDAMDENALVFNLAIFTSSPVEAYTKKLNTHPFQSRLPLPLLNPRYSPIPSHSHSRLVLELKPLGRTSRHRPQIPPVRIDIKPQRPRIPHQIRTPTQHLHVPGPGLHPRRRRDPILGTHMPIPKHDRRQPRHRIVRMRHAEIPPRLRRHIVRQRLVAHARRPVRVQRGAGAHEPLVPDIRYSELRDRAAEAVARHDDTVRGVLGHGDG